MHPPRVFIGNGPDQDSGVESSSPSGLADRGLHVAKNNPKQEMKLVKYCASAKASVNLSSSPGPKHTLSTPASRNPNDDDEQTVLRALDETHDTTIRALDLRIQHLETRVSAGQVSLEQFQRKVFRRLETALYREQSLELENSALRQQIKDLTEELEEADEDIRTLDDKVERTQEKRAAAFDQLTECLELLRGVRTDLLCGTKNQRGGGEGSMVTGMVNEMS